MDHLLRNATGHTLRVDCDLWLAILDLALASGWHPEGTSDPDPAVRIQRADQPEWEQHTLGSIQHALAARSVAPDAALAALEILSGPPAKEVAAVLGFLEEGHTRVYPVSAAEVKQGGGVGATTPGGPTTRS